MYVRACLPRSTASLAAGSDRLGRKSVWLILISSLMICAGAAFPIASQAETYVSGPVQGEWTTDGSPYIVIGNIEVPAGQALLIRSGVAVEFGQGLHMTVHGLLQALGAHGDSIEFRPAPGASTWGGIRFLESQAGCTLQYCILRDCFKQGNMHPNASGGAVFGMNCLLEIRNSSFRGCRSETQYPAEDGGGAVYLLNGILRIYDSEFTGCSTMAWCLSGGGAVSARLSEVLVSGCMFRDCMAHGMGGAIALHETSFHIENSIVVGCRGFHYGGGIGLSQSCTGQLYNNLVVDCTVEDLRGGGVYVSASPVEIHFCTVADNSAPAGEYGEGGGLYVTGSQPVVTHCIFWGNTAGAGGQIYPANLYYVDYCDVQDGYFGNTNINANPAFAISGQSLDYPGYYLSSLAAGQGTDSPCIDAGGVTAEGAGLDDRTTRTDLVPDEGLADLGFHHLANASSWVPELDTAPLLSFRALPNPFSNGTQIFLSGQAQTLDILDASGRIVAILRNMDAGDGARFEWNGEMDNGRFAPAGVYFLRISGNGAGIESGRLIRVR